MDIRELDILLSLGKAPWMIDKTFADRMVPVLLRQLAQGNVSLASFRAESEKKIDQRYRGMQVQDIGQYVPARKIKSKSNQHVAILPVFGSLTKRGELCSYGMRSYMNEIALLNENEDIAAIVIDLESPGGTVDGTTEFGLAVKSSKKPIVTFGDNIVASAAYWIASQSRHIVGNKNNPTEFGSIGVLYFHENYSKWIEDNIGSIEIMRAAQSVHKARLNVIEPLEDEYRAEVQADLNEMADEFIKVVKKGRGDRLDAKAEGLFTGRMFKTPEALKMGMIDSIGTLWDAINIAAGLANNHSKQNSNSNKNAMSFKKTVSSFFRPKKAKAAEEAQPAAAEDATPMWTEDMVFNTDGSGDGAFCLHADTDGNDRKFETKIDNNQGNEPPTDPAVTEDDNWSLVAEEEAPADTEEGEEGKGEKKEAKQPDTVAKLNVALKKFSNQVKKLTAEVAQLKKSNADLQKKLEAKPAGADTTVVAESDKGHEYGDRKAEQSWEKKAEQKVGAVKTKK